MIHTKKDQSPQQVHELYAKKISELEEQLQDEKEKVMLLSEALRKHRQEFQTLADNAPDIICRFSKDYQHLYVNPALEKATTVPTHVFIDKTPHQAGLPLEFADYWVKHIQSVFKTGKQVSLEFSFPTPIGEKYFQSLLVPEFATDGTVETVLSMSRDITQLKEHERAKDEFIAIVSHELKTPVTTLKALAQFLTKKFRKVQDLTDAEHLEKMDKHLSKLDNLISDLLDVSRIGGGQMQFSEDLFDFNQLVKEVIDDMQRTTDTHPITISGTARKKVRADRDRIGQVLMNFLSNAIKYTPDDTPIIVQVSSNKDHITCCVQDFGAGIPKAMQKKVFDRFFRVKKPRKQTSAGLGLGLYISSQIIQKQKGTIWVESEEGKGAVFCFTIPYGREKTV